MPMYWKLLLTLVIVTLASVMPVCVFACSCTPPGNPAESLAIAAAVFSGRVTAVSTPADGSEPEQNIVTFAVTHYWKGQDQTTFQIRTPSSSASCGVDFVVGQDYLVYASSIDGALTTNLCSRTALLATAGDDLAALGSPTRPTQPSGEHTPITSLPATGNSSAMSFAKGIVVATGVLIVVLGVITRRQRVAL